MNKPIAAGMIIAHLRPITSATKPQAPLARNPTRLASAIGMAIDAASRWRSFCRWVANMP